MPDDEMMVELMEEFEGRSELCCCADALIYSKWKRAIFPTQNLLETEFGSEESTPGPDYVSISRNTVEMWWFFWAAVRRKARIFKSGEHKRFGKTRNRAIEW